jgi:phosphoribosylanthranilate isomerase
MVWIKICGNTNLEDARAATDAGADALGFIFAPSPRQVTPDAAAAIIRELPPEVEKVGVFVNESPERMAALAQEIGLTAAQLHGDETPDHLSPLHITVHARRFRLFKTLHMANGHEPSFADMRKLGHYFDALLLDAGTSAQRGGTGRVFDWDDAQRLVGMVRVNSKVIVAGGLTAENVGEAVRRFQPWGVDVASGVEREPGRKDHEKLRAFIAAARSAT